MSAADPRTRGAPGTAAAEGRHGRLPGPGGSDHPSGPGRSLPDGHPDSTPAGGGHGGPFTGLGVLIRLTGRLERVNLPVWIAVLALIAYGSASGVAEYYPTDADRADVARQIAGNPSLRALTGPAVDVDTLGGLTVWRFGATIAVLVALMNIFAVVRHTRADEETGRTELLRAGVVGRFASLSAALAVVVAADLVLAVAVALSAVGGGLPAGGSWALGLTIGAVGMVFAAVAAVTAQVASGARAATGSAAGMLGLAYLLRAAGDASGGEDAAGDAAGAEEGGLSWLSWLSPIGWVARVQPYAQPRWWVLALAAGLVLALALGAIAYALLTRRDEGAGLVPVRPGRAAATRWLTTPEALALRLHRGALTGWTAAFAVAGIAVGAVADGVEDLLSGNDAALDVLERTGGAGDLVDAYFATVLGLLAMLAGVYAVSAVSRARSEEIAGRLEPVLAAGAGRDRYFAGHLAVALLGSVLLLVVGGFFTALGYGMVGGDVTAATGRLLGAALAYLPAVAVLAGAGFALVGLLPRAAVGGWVLAFGSLVIGQLGPTLGLDRRIIDVSPFAHIPNLPGADVTAEPLLVLTGIALALVLAGFAGVRRRDVGSA